MKGFSTGGISDNILGDPENISLFFLRNLNSFVNVSHFVDCKIAQAIVCCGALNALLCIGSIS